MIGGIRGPTGISNWEVEAATGKSWYEWLDALDQWQFERKTFNPLMRYLTQQYRLSLYWAQVVAVHYVMHRSYTAEASSFER